MDEVTGKEVWTDKPILYPTGFEKGGTNSTGGVAVGPHFDALGTWDTKFCGATLWSTGDGLQAQSVALPQNGNVPPWKSYFIDADGMYPKDRSGHMGDVEVVGCRGVGGVEEHYSTSFSNEDGTDFTARRGSAQHLNQRFAWRSKPLPFVTQQRANTNCAVLRLIAKDMGWIA